MNLLCQANARLPTDLTGQDSRSDPLGPAVTIFAII